MNDLQSAEPLRTLPRVPTAEPSPDTSVSDDPLRQLYSTAATPDPDSTRPTLPTSPEVELPELPGYTISAELARGGMGRVYAGRELALDREVAIKTLLPGANAERFVTEAKITARLPHPNIPPVYALGSLADGSPFLAMKLVRGRTLSALLKERPSSQTDLQRWVQVFEQVAQAVGFAHARGVIHRDLKPLNVMVGKFGEVQVMDWGLAREVRSADAGGPKEGSESAEVSFVPHSALPAQHLTQAGTVLGTPSYMAPEQARGEPADARADVFALGSTLAAILTGGPAFVGDSARETITKAAAADLSDVFARLDSCGADAELVTLAKRCLSANAEDRPTDGRAVAAEVGTYRAGVEARLRQAETERAEAVVREGEQRKRQRQFNRAVGVVATVLLAGIGGTVAGLVVALNRAEGERRAKVAAEQAEDETLAADRASTDEAIVQLIGSKPQLGSAERAYLEGARQRWQAFADRTGDDDRSRAIRGEGHHRVAELLLQLGEWAEAEAEYRRALDTRRQLADDYPAVARYRSNQADTHRGLAGVLNAQGKLADAAGQAGEAVRLFDRLASDEPSVPNYRGRAAQARHVLGAILLQQGRLAEGIAQLTSALDTLTHLDAELPPDRAVRQLLAVTHSNLGLAFEHSRRYAEAEEQCRLALAVIKQVVADPSSVPEDRVSLARDHTNLGLLLSCTGQNPKAAVECLAAIAVCEKLTTDFPAVPQYREQLARGLNLYGILLVESGDHAESEKVLTRAVSVLEHLIQADPNIPAYHLMLGDVLTNRSRTRASSGRVLAAATDLTRAGQEKTTAMRLDPVGTNEDTRAQWERIKGLTPGAK